ncbi:hypothetical protein M0R45_006509 [Rubus argutus]|uniref:Uncharacterized protein n=1 Tax=Rubus argutus TaxID=59490 RepID=A0AAW1YQT5_RUBAR
MDVRQRLYKVHGGVSCGLRIQEQRRHRGGQSELGLDGLSGAVTGYGSGAYGSCHDACLNWDGYGFDNYTSGLEALAQTFLRDHRYCGHTPQGITFVYTKFIFDSLLNCSISAYCGFSLIHYICHFDFSGSTMLGLLVPVSTCISILEWIISELDHQFLLDNAYYFEMKDAGFFDADWD